MSLVNCIKRSKMRVFRRMYMKRRESSGEYETDWQLIPNKYIKKWGSIEFSADDVTPFYFDIGSFNFTVINNTGYFSDTNQEQSFFYGKLNRYRTLVKIEAGYIDTDETEYPTVPTLYVGLLGEDVVHQESNEINFQVKGITSIFQEAKADEIPGLGVTQSAYTIITKIRDYVDANSVSVFQKYITSGGWHIYTTTNNYNIQTSTTLNNLTAWELIKKLAGAENCIAYVDKLGDFYFRYREDITSTSLFRFSGIGDSNRAYGHNIMRKLSVDEGIRKVINRISVKLGVDDTDTSYYIKKETWTWGDSSSSFRFGVKEYKYENEFLNTATAMTVATTIYNAFSEPKQEVKVKTKFVPQLNLYDRVTAYYQTKQFITGDLWGHFLWGQGFWGTKYGYNINVNGDYKITRISHNLDDFSSDLTLRYI